MIKYELKCNSCQNKFESWFGSSKEYERVKKLKLLSCVKCKSVNVDKSLMSPNVISSKENIIKNSDKNNKIKKKIIEYQNFIKKNLDYVGDNFSYEVRSIHYNKKKPKKGIYGKSSMKEVKELKDEGIDTEVIPWIKDLEN